MASPMLASNMLSMKAALCLLLASSACMHHALANVDSDWLENEPVQAAQTGVAVPFEKFDLLAFAEENTGLTAQLDAINPIVDLGDGDEEFLLTFTVYNPTEASKQLLTWATPMHTDDNDHIVGNVFEVKDAAGHDIKYVGVDTRMATNPDTGKPPEDAYVTIKAGESITNQVNPGCSYEWTHDGYYYIRVRQPNTLHDTYANVMQTFTKVFIKNVAQHTHQETAKIAARNATPKMRSPMMKSSTVQYEGCSTANIAELEKWHADAADKIDAAIACTESNSCESQVDLWFGKSITQTRYADKITAQFKTMKSVMEKTIYACDNAAIRVKCIPNIFAFVRPFDLTQKVHICKFTFDYPDYSEKVQTVVHELSHFNHIGGTNDNAYGESTCQSLAISNPDAAIKTADNVGYFAKYQPGPFCNAPAGFSACKDTLINCKQLAAIVSQSWMCQQYKESCCASCGGATVQDTSSCGGSSKPANSGTSPVANPIPTPTPTIAPTSCLDNDSSSAWLFEYSCATLASYKWCTTGANGDYISEMSKRCPESCHSACTAAV